MGGPDVDVFISYSRADVDFVRRVAEAVAREGFSVWWDADLPPHRAYGDVITEEIGGAKAAIVVWSRTAAASEWVRAEADVARNQKKLIQTSIDGSMPPMPFNQIQFASLEDWNGEVDHPGWRKVKASLSILCGAPDGESVPPQSPPPSPSPAPAPPPLAPPVSRPTGAGRGLTVVIGVLVLLLLAGAVTIGLLWNREDRVREVVRVESQPGPREEAPAAKSPAPERQETRSVPPAAERGPAPLPRTAVINDPDGFTNVRDTPSTSGAIVARINDGERFSTRVQQRPWWRVRLDNGTEGWVHRSRIRIVE